MVRRLPGEVTLPQELPDGGDKVGLWRGRLLVLWWTKFSGPCLEFEHFISSVPWILVYQKIFSLNCFTNLMY